jgi:hypothetical protein
MEGAPMTAVTAQDASLSNLLGALRGEIVKAGLGHPDVLHVEIRDLDGDRWNLVTQDAEWQPANPADLVGQVIEKAEVSMEGKLRCQLAGGAVLAVKPAKSASEGDPPYWELITPGGAALEFGPGARWQISSADAPASR